MKIIITESQKKMLLESIDSNLYYIEEVPKKGMSLFSNKDVKKGEEVGKLLSKTKTLNGRPIWQIEEKLWETDVIGRYINHSSKPKYKSNCKRWGSILNCLLETLIRTKKLLLIILQ